MKLLKAVVHNLGSYSNLEFDYSYSSLALVYGATGSGKSTLQDIPVWIMYGITAKDGNADDVRSWTTPNKPTIGTLQLQLKDKIITITRIRGKSSQNDLYWTEEGSETQHRGKDLNETQRLLNECIGVDPYLYTIGAYYNEFSPTGTFFTAKASEKRQLFENIADLDVPLLLTSRIAEERKARKSERDLAVTNVSNLEGRLLQHNKHTSQLKASLNTWEEKQASLRIELEVKHSQFETQKQSKIAALELKAEEFEKQRLYNCEKYALDSHKKTESLKKQSTCEHCGELSKTTKNQLVEITSHYSDLIDQECKKPNIHLVEIERLKTTENTYQERIEAEAAKINPFLDQWNQTEKTKQVLEYRILIQKAEVDNFDKSLADLQALQKVTEDLRGELLRQTVRNLQDSTNRYLETYFDSEIRVEFALNQDKLDVTIWKSGYECSYKQLSKGQRSLLKLTFSLSAMKAAADKAGVHFDCLMLDEALDGLDASLKVKAFTLFSELALTHENILVIDHSEELQNLFENKYFVAMREDTSYIKEV